MIEMIANNPRCGPHHFVVAHVSHMHIVLFMKITHLEEIYGHIASQRIYNGHDFRFFLQIIDFAMCMS